MSKRQKINWTIITIVGIIIYTYVLTSIDGRLPLVDSTTTVLQVVAMILMLQRVKEQWLLWIVVNVLSIGMWAYAFMNTGGDIAVMVMWTAYLFNSVYGYINWKKAEKESV